MKKRLSKKLHKKWLALDVIDLSQDSFWRKKLFEADKNEIFDIDKNNLDNLPQTLVKAIIRYNLKYRVAKVDGSETDAWLSEDGSIVFKFWVVEFPNLNIFSGNNPDSL